MTLSKVLFIRVFPVFPVIRTFFEAAKLFHNVQVLHVEAAEAGTVEGVDADDRGWTKVQTTSSWARRELVKIEDLVLVQVVDCQDDFGADVGSQVGVLECDRSRKVLLDAELVSFGQHGDVENDGEHVVRFVELVSGVDLSKFERIGDEHVQVFFGSGLDDSIEGVTQHFSEVQTEGWFVEKACLL